MVPLRIALTRNEGIRRRENEEAHHDNERLKISSRSEEAIEATIIRKKNNDFFTILSKVVRWAIESYLSWTLAIVKSSSYEMQLNRF